MKDKLKKILLKTLRKRSKIILLFFIGFILLFAHFLKVAKANASERPQWKNVYVAEEKCEMNIRNLLLYLYGENVKVEKKGFICKVISGKWFIVSNSNVNSIIETDIKKIQIDHIVPWSYLKKHVEIEDFEEVYNIIANLDLSLNTYNASKSNKICYTKAICDHQRSACIKTKAVLKLKNIKNTIDCHAFMTQ